jgi:hypothetical protein
MKTTRTILSLLGAAALAVAAQATTVTLDTSSLIAGGTYYVDFQLNDGSATGNGNNSAAITGFDFGGGSATGDIGLFGGVTGDLSSGVSLTDTDPFNEFYQSFTAGSFLRFDLWLSDNFDGPVPDIFGFALLDENLFNLGTFSLGTDQFLIVELNGAGLTFETFAGVDGVPAPRVPEAGSTALLVAVALLGLAGIRRRLARAPLAA